MSKFLKFLIYSLETLDGHRGTATSFIEEKKKEYMRQRFYVESMKNVTDQEIDRMARHQVMRKVFIKYTIQRARMKISFAALKSLHTINEHWLRQIVSSFKFLRDSGQIKVQMSKILEEKHILAQLMKGEIKCCLKLLIKYNIEKELSS